MRVACRLTLSKLDMVENLNMQDEVGPKLRDGLLKEIEKHIDEVMSIRADESFDQLHVHYTAEVYLGRME